MMHLAAAAAATVLMASPAISSDKGTDRVFAVLLNTCRDYVSRKTDDLVHAALLPISDDATNFFPKAVLATSKTAHLYNDRYAIAWGSVDGQRHCLVNSDISIDAEKMFLVDQDDFLRAADRRFGAMGFSLLNNAESIARVDVIPTWATIDETSGMKTRIVLVGMDKEDGMIDVGFIGYSETRRPRGE